MENNKQIDLFDVGILQVLIEQKCDNEIKALSIHEIDELLRGKNVTVSYKTIQNRTAKLENSGLIKQGLKHKRRKRFYISESGKLIFKK